MNCENQECILLKFHKFSSFNDIINSKENGIVGGNLIRLAIPCRVCFWSAARERLPTCGVSYQSRRLTGIQQRLIGTELHINNDEMC